MSSTITSAHYALFHRTAAEKNFDPGKWIDSGIRGDSEETCLRTWRSFAPSKTDWQETQCRLVPIEDAGTVEDDDDDEVVLGVIDSAMILAMERLRDQLTEAGGRGEVWACNTKTHESHFGSATEVMRLPMVVREWVPDRQVVISSLADLDSLANAPMKEGVNE